jgi:hypothetical protein
MDRETRVRYNAQKKDIHKAIVNTRHDLHGELSLMIQGEAHITKP